MNSKVVVDTSIAIKWIFDEPNSDIASALLNEWFSTGVKVQAPVLFAYEVANVLHQRVRKGEITLHRAKRSLANALLPTIDLDATESRELSERALEFAHEYALPAAYDAHYLALAERENCEYWTADTRLLRAVGDKLPWVRTLDDYRTRDKEQTEGKDETS